MKKHRKFLKDLQTSEQFYNDQESRQIIGELIAMIDEGFNKQKADWIPCEERLPEPIRPVLVTVKNWINDKPFVRMGRFHTNHWEVEECVVGNSKIIAWQPLPQPYKKRGAEDEL